MKFTIQKTTFWNRIAAAVLDFIIIVVVVTGVALLVSWASGYDKYATQIEEGTVKYIKQYELVTEEEFAKFLEDKAKYDSESKFIATTEDPYTALSNKISTQYTEADAKITEKRMHYSQANKLIKFEITPEKFATLSESEKQFYKGSDYEVDYNNAKVQLENDAEYVKAKEYFDKCKAMDEALAKDEEVSNAYAVMMSLSIMIISLGLLGGYLIVDFLFPLIFKNGQTLGKKIFGVAVMHSNGVRVNAQYMFIRTVLGKFTIETMVPVLMILMLFMGTIGIVGPIVLLGIAILEIVLLIKTENRQAIHDLLAKTVTVDIKSQQFFDNEEALLDYKKKLAEEEAVKGKYF